MAKELHLTDENIGQLLKLPSKQEFYAIATDFDGTYDSLEDTLKLFFAEDKAKEIASVLRNKAIATLVI
ncbi:hypothetical protein V4D30_01550 [Thermodesulfovibrio sp. 3907-1M]|uniref:Uncharacterized protein n=1 Tax=Thermodesulfovibrio autotrophicus TaxID=3118333 RepID=A0AAU8GWX5_9BACT